jgi:hypothetical protein
MDDVVAVHLILAFDRQRVPALPDKLVIASGPLKSEVASFSCY